MHGHGMHRTQHGKQPSRNLRRETGERGGHRQVLQWLPAQRHSHSHRRLLGMPHRVGRGRQCWDGSNDDCRPQDVPAVSRHCHAGGGGVCPLPPAHRGLPRPQTEKDPRRVGGRRAVCGARRVWLLKTFRCWAILPAMNDRCCQVRSRTSLPSPRPARSPGRHCVTALSIRQSVTLLALHASNPPIPPPPLHPSLSQAPVGRQRHVSVKHQQRNGPVSLSPPDRLVVAGATGT